MSTPRGSPSTRSSAYSSPSASSAARSSPLRASPARVYNDISNVGSPSSPYTKLKQAIRKNHELKVSVRQSQQDKENAIHLLRTKSTQSLDELKDEISTLEDRLLTKSHEVKTLQSRLSYATADHNTAYEMERSLRRNAQNECRVLERKVKKSREVIHRYKEEVASLKSELTHQTVLTKKYSQRCERLRKKLIDAPHASGATQDNAEELERLRVELRERRQTSKGDNAFYELWRDECAKSRDLKKELNQTQDELEKCDGELVQVQEEFTALTANSRSQAQRLQKRVTRITNKSGLNTFILLMVLNSTLKKMKRMQTQHVASNNDSLMITDGSNPPGEITELQTSLSQWGNQWQTLNANVTQRMTELMSMLHAVSNTNTISA